MEDLDSPLLILTEYSAQQGDPAYHLLYALVQSGYVVSSFQTLDHWVDRGEGGGI